MNRVQDITPPGLCAPAPRWYAVHVRPGAEHSVREYLDSLQLDDVLLPLLKTPIVSGPLAGVLRYEPLFPTYVFFQTANCGELLGRFARLPEIRYVVGMRPNVPSAIPETEMAVVRFVAGCDRDYRLGPIPERGRRARVIAGPMEGLEGLVVWRNKREARLASAISVVGRAVELVLPLDLIVLSDYETGNKAYKKPHRGGRRARRARAAAASLPVPPAADAVA